MARIRLYFLFLVLILFVACSDADTPRESLPQQPPPQQKFEDQVSTRVESRPSDEARPLKGTLSPLFVAHPELSFGAPYSEAEAHIRRQLLEELWRTPLARLYWAYLTDSVSNIDVMARSQEITNIVTSEPAMQITRILALNLLTKDLYDRGLFHGDVESRVMILQGDVSARRLSQSRFPVKELAYQATVLFVLSLPFGSPVVRDYSKKVLRKTIEKVPILRLFTHPPSEVNTTRFKDIFGPRLFEGYELRQGLFAFLNVFGGYSVGFWFWMDWKNAAATDIVEDHMMLYGYDEIIRALSEY